MIKNEWRHLSCFMAVAEAGSFGGAAQKLGTQQPIVSRMVKKLEKMLDVKLFDRQTRPIRLTRAGEIFYKDIQAIFHQWEQAKRKIKQQQYNHRHLRLALSDDIQMHRISELLALTRDEDPEVEIELFELSLQESIQKLQNNELDMGITHAHIKVPGITVLSLWRDRIIAILPTRHPLLVYKAIPIEKLLEFPFISYHPTLCKGTHDQIHTMLKLLDAPIQVTRYASSFELMCAQVCAGYGISLIGQSRFDYSSCKQMVARPLDGLKKYLTTYLLLPEPPFSAATENLIKRAKALDDLQLKLHNVAN